MRLLSRPFVSLCVVLGLVSVDLSSSVPLLAQGRAGSSEGPPGRERDRAADRCAFMPDPGGLARGLDECPPAGSSAGVARADFNGDRITDIAIGVPYEDIDGVNAAGVVHVLYGSGGVLPAIQAAVPDDQLLDPRDGLFTLTSNGHFGWALAAGDFDGDGDADLAISMPGRNPTGSRVTGGVVVFNGGPTGLVRDNFFVTTGLPLGRMGQALTWGDFNGDDIGDLAIGAPDSDAKGDGFACIPATLPVTRAGVVLVYYGQASSGLGDFGRQVLRQGKCDYGNDGFGVGDGSETDDRFGSALTTLKGGGIDDLVIGAPYEDLGLFDKIDAGVVHVVPGGADGLQHVVVSPLVMSQDSAGIDGAAESGDLFGRVLASGLLDNDTVADLVIGIPNEDLTSNSQADAGAVQVIYDVNAVVGQYGSDLFLSQADIAGVAVEAGDRFGWAVAVGDFDGDLRPDLAVGAPGEDFGAGFNDVGLVNVVYGTTAGLSTSRTQTLHQDSTGVLDVAEAGDQFGYALSSWNYGGPGLAADLAVGVPFEDVVSSVDGTLKLDAGAIHILFGAVGGLQGTGSQFWTQDSPGVKDVAQPGDRFGHSVY